MRYIYYATLFCGAIFFAYFVGVHVGNIKCKEKIANANYEQIVINTKIMEQTNETVLHTNVGDMRRVLRERYTIAE